MDVLDIFLDDDDIAVTAKPTEKPRVQDQSDDLDLLIEEFTTAPDTASKKDALLALLRIGR